MADTTNFLETVNKGYTFKGESFKIGCAMMDGAVVSGADVLIPFRTLNRHGLIAGATGTGKTKTLQVMAEGLSDASIPVLMMDIKGDLSGIAAEGASNEKIADRSQKLNIEFKPTAYPTDLLTLSNQKGARLRATVSEFGPVLLSKILGLNDTQGGFVAMIFKYCDDTKLPLLDLKDFIKVLQYVSDEGKADMEKEYGKISTTSTGTILRKIIELQQQGADVFFGEKSFEVDDLMRINEDGKGMISIVRVTDLQDRPKLFSTFMLQLLAELYATCPEEGDMDKTYQSSFEDEWDFVIDNYTSGANDPEVIDSIKGIAYQQKTETEPPTKPVVPVKPIEKPLPPVIAKKEEKPVVTKEPEPTVIKPVAKVIEPVKAPTIEEKFVTRKKTFIKDIPISGDSIELRFYDNAEIDGDSISLFLNNKLIFEHIRLTANPYIIKLAVSELNDLNELTMVAENLGTIPPNTSYMVAIINEERYDAYLASTEGESAMIRLIKAK